VFDKDTNKRTKIEAISVWIVLGLGHFINTAIVSFPSSLVPYFSS